MEPGPDLIGGVVRYMDAVFGLYAVHTDSAEELEHVNGYFARVVIRHPPSLVSNVADRY